LEKWSTGSTFFVVIFAEGDVDIVLELSLEAKGVEDD
jgi:hypothetical protein